MLVGVLADERFGPVVACGAGGGTAEVLGDVAVRLAPLAREEAYDMIVPLRSLALLERADADIDALADIAVRVGALADAHPAIAELDLNPVMVGPRRRAGRRRARARRAARRPARVPGGGTMKRIGLLGGMSWESTIEYYRLVNELVAERLGGLHSADCILRSVDFAEIEVLQREGRWAEAGTRLAQEAQALEAAGAELLVLCTNTMHKLAAEIELAITIPFVHIADTTADAVRAAGWSASACSPPATRWSRTSTSAGCAPSTGSTCCAGRGRPQDRPRRHLRRVVPSGSSRTPRASEYRRIMARWPSDGAQGILLGCTEIDLLVGAEDSPVPVYDTTRLHAERAVTLALAP